MATPRGRWLVGGWCCLRSPRQRYAAGVLPGEVLELEVFVDPVDRALAAQARLLDAAEGGDLVRHHAGVDPDDAGLEGSCDPPGARRVLSEQVGGQPVFGVVGPSDSFGLALELDERKDRAERLLPAHEHALKDVTQDGRGEEPATAWVDAPAAEDRSTTCGRVGDVFLHFGDGSLVDQGSDLAFRMKSRPYDERGGPLGEGR